MSNTGKLEERLFNILHCTICLNLPKDAVYQCANGHLMCPGCLASLRLEAEQERDNATCLRCPSVLSHRLCRNVAAELVVAELRAPCRFCSAQLPRKCLERHERRLCGERMVECRYRNIGCGWRGPHQQARAHEGRCPKLCRPGTEILQALQESDRQYTAEFLQYGSIFDLLSTQKVVYKDVQFGGILDNGLSDSSVYYTFSFMAYKREWRLEARLVRQEPQAVVTYQLIAESTDENSDENHWSCSLKYLLLQGPYGNISLKPRIVKFSFSESSSSGPQVEMTLSDPSQYSLLVSGKPLNFRLIMFLITTDEQRNTGN